MYSSPACLYNSIIRIAPGILIAIVFSCNGNPTVETEVHPKHFKAQTPFILNSRGIIINTYWGNERKPHVLCLDNHSPSWIKSSLIQYNQSFRKSKNLSFKTSTADGSVIQGEVGICDSIFFENIVFKNVPFYIMPNNSQDDKTDDGVLGIDALSKGIWRIDFKKQELTFVSDIDSISEMRQTEIFPATINQQSITVDVDFGNKDIKTLAIDIGYNGYMLLPPGDFKPISSPAKTFVTPSRFNTPASRNIVNNLSVVDTVNINHNWFATVVSSNEAVKERLIGLAFFKRFDYIIFDFINKHIYVPKKVW
jgi:predicted aspartyl protease